MRGTGIPYVHLADNGNNGLCMDIDKR